MVRGRRTRKAAASTTASAATTTNGVGSPKSASLSPSVNPLSPQNGVKVLAKGNVVLMDDFCCASPKRKEYKIDELLLKNGATQNGFTCASKEGKGKQSRMVLRGAQNGLANGTGAATGNGRICPVAGNEITRFLLSQSKSKSRKTRKKSPNFELVNDDTCDSFTHATSLQEAPTVVVKMEAEDEVKVEEIAENGEEGGEENPFQMFGRLPIGGGTVPEENIFLQEPVLKLTVDECVLVQPKSEPSEMAAEKKQKKTKNGAGVALINQDSNSGDSGVVVDKGTSTTTTAQPLETTPKPQEKNVTRPRVPTTPHRILCPGVKEEGMQVEVEDDEAQMTNRKLDLTEKEEDGAKVQNGLVANGEAKAKPERVAQKQPQETMKAPKNPNGVVHAKCHQSTMEDFFRVRRSVRKTKKEVEREEQLAIEKAILSECDVGLAVKMFENKGRGIVATRPFARGEFVVEYVGEFISIAEANRREKLYAQDQSTGCYMYYFKHKNKQYCIDATEETGKLGRLVNHSRNGNLMTRTVEVNGQPHLVLIAKEDIEEGKELNYDYGDRSKESLLHHPWLAF